MRNAIYGPAAQWKTAFKDQLAESGSKKTKENIILHGKFCLVENDPVSLGSPCWKVVYFLASFSFG